MQIKTSGLREDGIGLLKEFFYEAIFIPDGAEADEETPVNYERGKMIY